MGNQLFQDSYHYLLSCFSLDLGVSHQQITVTDCPDCSCPNYSGGLSLNGPENRYRKNVTGLRSVVNKFRLLPYITKHPASLKLKRGLRVMFNTGQKNKIVYSGLLKLSTILEFFRYQFSNFFGGDPIVSNICLKKRASLNFTLP